MVWKVILIDKVLLATIRKLMLYQLFLLNVIQIFQYLKKPQTKHWVKDTDKGNNSIRRYRNSRINNPILYREKWNNVLFLLSFSRKMAQSKFLVTVLFSIQVKKHLVISQFNVSAFFNSHHQSAGFARLWYPSSRIRYHARIVDRVTILVVHLLEPTKTGGPNNHIGPHCAAILVHLKKLNHDCSKTDACMFGRKFGRKFVSELD